MTAIPICRPYVFLRCKKCGQIRKIYEIAILAEPENLAIQELERKIEAKHKLLKQLETKRRNLAKRLKNQEGNTTRS